ncbi:hypothetical protein D7030_10015 [Flavobacteriaceae bacterium AU392]|nr:hypothetical protein D1817_06795 [Flavobacteriaceae bacterium]RKM83621.1 hypothetical protein D7030_10015 [Flavobacteriaceae bacterium AU392]
MDELELLKKDWQKDKGNYPKLTYNEIYKMILKKSSSIVKWIFIISILEFVFWTGFSLLFKDSKHIKEVEELNASNLFISLSIIGFVILFYFFYKFYKNYRNISVTDSAKILMENILRTRRTVKQYVAFNIIFLVIGVVSGVFMSVKQDESFSNQLNDAAANGEIFKYYAAIIITTIIALAAVIGILLLFYWLIYGLLLRKLNHNYSELKKLEI